MYLIVDTETGGIGLDKSLLSVGLIFADDQFNVISKAEYLVKPNDSVYVVEPRAMEINGIDLIKHDKVAKKYKDTGNSLYASLFLFGDGGKNKLVVVGKNVHFDLTHIWDKLISRATWEGFCSYQLLDLSSVWKFLEITGKVPKLQSTSLGAIADHLGVEKGEAHTALGDCVTTLNCMKELQILPPHILSLNTENKSCFAETY